MSIQAQTTSAKDTTYCTITPIFYKHKRDTTHYDYLFYVDNTFVRCEPGIIIESGEGSDQIAGYFLEKPKIEIYTDSGKLIKGKDFLYYK
jgi:hypothetical protein